MVWHWFHGIEAIPSCPFLLIGAAWGWLGFLICGAILAVLTRERAVFAATVGAAVYIPLSFTETLGVEFSQKGLSLLTASCKLDADDADLGSFSHRNGNRARHSMSVSNLPQDSFLRGRVRTNLKTCPLSRRSSRC